MPEIIPSITCNLDVDLLSASLPLFEESKVGGIEWSFDTLYGLKQIPEWFTELLNTYSEKGRLLGHGVYFSIFSGKWSADQENWLAELKSLTANFRFDQISEHFGFMTGKSFHDGAPLSIPYSASTLAIGRDRLSRIYDISNCPVGLENLAFSYSLDEVKRQGEFLEQLVEPINGFIILDLHNIYCQLQNFSIAFEDIIKLYPLHRVREIHISGGSWEPSQLTGGRIRRDTHDEAVPEEVFDLLSRSINRCLNLKYVVLEQMGDSLKSFESRNAFYQDFLKMENIIRENNVSRLPAENLFLPFSHKYSGRMEEDEVLYDQQLELSFILENSSSYHETVKRLNSSSLANSAWNIESWDPGMLETAISIAQKWKHSEV